MNPLYEPGSQICAEVRQACFLDKYNDDSIAILPNAVNSFFNLDDFLGCFVASLMRNHFLREYIPKQGRV